MVELCVRNIAITDELIALADQVEAHPERRHLYGPKTLAIADAISEMRALVRRGDQGLSDKPKVPD